MYIDKIVKLLAPITSTVYDHVAMSFPVPTKNGCCVLYYIIEDNETGGERQINIITGAMVNIGSYTQINANDVFSDEVINSLQASNPTAAFVEVFQQRKRCAEAMDELITSSEYETQGFPSLKTVPEEKIERFTLEILTYASMLGLQKMYSALLKDIYGLSM